MVTGAQVASMALAGVAAALMSVRGVFVLSGAIAVIAGLTTAALFRGVSPAVSPGPALQPAEG